MKKSYIIIGVLVVLALFAFFNGKSTYNSMMTLDQDVEQSWAQVQVQYQRRLDLIPNLVETVKGYAKHESETFENVTRARAGLTDAYNEANEANSIAVPENEQAFMKEQQSQDALKKALSIYVNAVREAYPDLKADTQFINLQTQLEGTENRIATERGRYTEAVRTYNVAVKRFPANIWASIFGFKAKSQFQADAEAAKAPTVTF
ncbi:MAG: LemA family protein [Muribaculaceae bacterium]|nr:LemA family protein [Muribaculaceae bacterium]